MPSLFVGKPLNRQSQKISRNLLDNILKSTILAGVMVLLGNERRIYVTVRDPKTGKSKHFTVRGDKLTAARIVKLFERAITEEHRKAG